MHHKPLQHALQPHFDSLDPRRLDFIARFIIALLHAQTVNLNKLGRALSNYPISSNAKRIKRFLNFEFAPELIARFVLTFVRDEQLILTMDRTNWKFGLLNLNFLVIGIAYHGIALPIVWVNLDKAGNSNTGEREAILERLLKLVPAKRIHGFTADREFIGAKWFKTLLESGLNPVIRIKSDTFIKHRNKSAPAWVFFNATKQGAVDELTKARVMGLRVFVLGTRTPEGELLMVVTLKRPSKALLIYGQRWEIETLFGALKSRGFNLEETHMTDVSRSERLFGLLVLALTWGLLVGELVTAARPMKVKKHGYALFSRFRRGLDCLVQILVTGASQGFVWDDVVMLLTSS
jgi:Transposase DDE domain